MGEEFPSFAAVLVFIGWVALCIVWPREFERKAIALHYREWVRGAYWHRNYNKWVFRDLVFYPDELWGDFFLSLVKAAGFNAAYLIIVGTKVRDFPFPLVLVAGSVSTFAVLLVMSTIDRFTVPREEIARREAIDPTFSGRAEIERLLSEPQHRRWVRRVIGRPDRVMRPRGV